MLKFPPIVTATKLFPIKKRLFIGAYGFEERSLGWVNSQKEQGAILTDALIFKYKVSKGKNRIKELREALGKIGVINPIDIPCNVYTPYNLEDLISLNFKKQLPEVEEVVIDISAMTKLLILICLCKLNKFTGNLKIVYSEAEDYAPTQEEYEKIKKDMETIAKFPSQGVASIIRVKCLSSIRMQGQPVTMIAFTSFNEQLVRHMLGTINPHRILFINGRPPRKDFKWREKATQEIHKRLIEEYRADNPIDDNKLLKRVASTLDYVETIDLLNKEYNKFAIHERIICSATGSKMQTVGLFFSKIIHSDIHIEYPTPDSYFVEGMSMGIRKVHEIQFPRFACFLKEL